MYLVQVQSLFHDDTGQLEEILEDLPPDGENGVAMMMIPVEEDGDDTKSLEEVGIEVVVWNASYISLKFSQSSIFLPEYLQIITIRLFHTSVSNITANLINILYATLLCAQKC